MKKILVGILVLSLMPAVVSAEESSGPASRAHTRQTSAAKAKTIKAKKHKSPHGAEKAKKHKAAVTVTPARPPAEAGPDRARKASLAFVPAEADPSPLPTAVPLPTAQRSMAKSRTTARPTAALIPEETPTPERKNPYLPDGFPKRTWGKNKRGEIERSATHDH